MGTRNGPGVHILSDLQRECGWGRGISEGAERRGVRAFGKNTVPVDVAGTPKNAMWLPTGRLGEIELQLEVEGGKRRPAGNNLSWRWNGARHTPIAKFGTFSWHHVKTPSVEQKAKSRSRAPIYVMHYQQQPKHQADNPLAFY